MGSSPEKAQQILESYRQEELDFNQQLTRSALNTDGDRAHITALKDHLTAVGANMLILGSEELMKMGSFVRHALKQVTDIHVLVVKSDTLGKYTRTPG